jgi:hypothetical protein
VAVEVETIAVTLAGVQHVAEVPTKYALRKELSLAFAYNRERGGAAIVAMCVPTLNLRKFYRDCHFDPYEFGGLAWEQLNEKGVSDAEIRAASNLLFNRFSKGLFPEVPSEGAVRDAEGFSKPTTDGSSGTPSGSTGTGGSSPAGT